MPNCCYCKSPGLLKKRVLSGLHYSGSNKLFWETIWLCDSEHCFNLWIRECQIDNEDIFRSSKRTTAQQCDLLFGEELTSKST